MPASNAYASLFEQRTLVVGVARDCERTVRTDVLRLFESLKGCKGLWWLVVESDSGDDTIGALRALENDLPGFRFVSLGSLRQAMPLRTQRLAHCRNAYLEELNCNPLYADIDCVVVADLDGVNSLITRDGFASCWSRPDWGACTANQRGPYYDIWSLRHPLWSPNDWREQYNFFLVHNARKRVAWQSALRSRMIVVNTTEDWIEVDSAFGGLAVYRRNALNGVKYIGLGETGQEVCEHVSLNSQIRSAGYRIFINPELVNAGVTEHVRQHLLVPRLRSYFVRRAKQLLLGRRNVG